MSVAQRAAAIASNVAAPTQCRPRRAAASRTAACVAACVFGALLWAGVPRASLAAAPPSFESVRSSWTPSDAVLLDRHGEPLQTLRLDPSVRRLDWVALGAVSPPLRRAMLLSEDRRFLEHAGIDWRAIAGALARPGQTVRGASTITMQLAGLLDDAPRSGRRSAGQKLGQAVDAWLLEQRWTKAQILEAYLNLVGFRGELVGIGALSELLFGKAPSALDVEEASITAALVRGPNAPPARVAWRACLLLREQEFESACTGLEARVALALARKPAASPLAPSLAPHLARRLLGTPGERRRSSVDAGLQRLARESLERQLRALVQRNVEDGAVLVLDNTSGEVLAWVGSSGQWSSAAAVDAVTAPRQAGSTLKPFLYAQAIAERRLTAASLLDDRPLELPAGGGLYLPQNYDRDFRGLVSVRSALGASLNVPAVRVATMVGVQPFAETLRALGIQSVDRPGDYYGPSLALGSADVTLLELANAYRTLANGGRWSPIRFDPRASVAPAAGRRDDAAPTGRVGGRGVRDAVSATARQALDPAASFIVSDILADRNARARTFGWDSPLVTLGWAAVKTGTSKDMRDSWCIGFTARYTVAVWVGNASGAPTWNVSGSAGAAPVWASLVRALHAGDASVAPQAPAGVERQALRFEDAIEAPRSEWFVVGTSMTMVSVASRSPGPAIVQPPDGTVVALDPDIPPRNQRLTLRARSDLRNVAWRIDGRPLATGSQVQWFPWPGRHRLALVDAEGTELESVHVDVRGARVRSR